MTTTIQVSNNLSVGKYMVIDGERCEVEAASFTPAITNGQANEELVKVMAAELKYYGHIKEVDGQYVWSETGLPLVPEEEYED